MNTYRYKGFDSVGGRVAGVVSAVSVQQALLRLSEQGLHISHISIDGSQESWKINLGIDSEKIGLSELEFLTKELSLLLESGVRVDRALDILGRGAESARVQKLVLGLSADLKQGKQFSQAVAARPTVFDPLYVNLVAIGEAGGRLTEIFQGLANDLRFRRELRQKIISAAAYPAVVAVVSVLAVVFIFNFVVPNLDTLFSGATDLPWYTEVLLSLSEFMRKWQWLLLVFLVALASLFWQKRGDSRVVALIDRSVAFIPILRSLNITLERVRFSSGLSLMLHSGVAIDKALVLAAGNVQSLSLRSEMTHVISKIKRGESLSSCLKQTQLFSDYFSSLVEVGEESGQLAKVFGEVAERSRAVFSENTLRLTTLLEPILILFMGLIVGAVVVVMMLSITSVTDINL